MPWLPAPALTAATSWIRCGIADYRPLARGATVRSQGSPAKIGDWDDTEKSQNHCRCDLGSLAVRGFHYQPPFPFRGSISEYQTFQACRWLSLELIWSSEGQPGLRDSRR